MKVQRLNRSYNGHDRYTHRIEFYGGGSQLNQMRYVRVRNWLWEQFGPSAELNLARDWIFGAVPKWAWDADKSCIYITEESYTMFMLKKEFFENAENL
jgi:hypothetical protein